MLRESRHGRAATANLERLFTLLYGSDRRETSATRVSEDSIFPRHFFFGKLFSAENQFFVIFVFFDDHPKVSSF